MSRFILYSGIVHALAFVGAVTYLTTQPKENLPEFLRPSTASIETIETGTNKGVSTDFSVAEKEGDPESKSEMRDRKMRASIPTPPETPRVLEKASGAKKIPSVLPAKKGSTAKASEESIPEMGKDISQSNVVADSEIDQDQSKQESESDKSESDDSKSSMMMVAEQTPIDDENAPEENLEIAPFDVDEIANKHISEVKKEEQAEAAKKMAALEIEKQAAIQALLAKADSDQKSEAKAGSESAGSGSSEGQNSAAPAPVQGENVRALSEMKQKSGNRKPEFDVDDRRAGRNGMVVFLAYINTDGRPREFQMLSSSGHRSLDAKTLKALKTWKFMPGQEGWVEIPFQWDLKTSDESPATLRRSVSR